MSRARLLGAAQYCQQDQVYSWLTEGCHAKIIAKVEQR